MPSEVMRLIQRDIRLDGLRGLLLIIMAGVHVPSPISHWLQEPFGFTSAAEGFLFLGAVLAGRVYGALYGESNWRTMARRVWNRARRVYAIHVMLVLLAVLIAWEFADSLTPLAEHFHDFLAHPLRSLALIPLLLHQPPLFDILPLYVVFLCLTPWLLAAARRHGWKRILTVSALVWLAAQFESHEVGDAAGLVHLRLGSFNLAAWQLLWVGGLALGESLLHGQVIRRQHRTGLLTVASAIVLLGLLCRHGLWPQAWFPPGLFLWMDKWTLGPLRLLNFGAWVVLLLIWNPKIPASILAPFALLGRNSLPVFAFHLPLAIAAATTIQLLALSNFEQIAIGFSVIAALFPWAAWQEYNRHRVPQAVPVEAPDQALAPIA